MQKIFYLCLGLVMALAVGCSSTQYAYKKIQKENDSYNARVFAATPLQLKSALIHMLLSKQFVIDKEDELERTIVASRYFSQGHNNIVIVLQARMFSQDDTHQKLYLNGIQTTQRNYIVDRTRFLLWVIPLPGGGGKEVTKTKDYEASIEDRSFYSDLFDQIGRNLK